MPTEKIEDEVVILYMHSRTGIKGFAPTLARPELVSFGDQTFLSGNMITSADNWASGRRTRINVADIVYMISFETKEAYDEMRKAHPRRRRPPWRRAR
ncbi:MAG: hypothetical protein ACYSVY_06430 [Planctomycetota bacterium]|jgi:hypothetical protein